MALIYFTDDTWKRERDEVFDWLLQEKIIGKSNVRCLQVPGRDGIVRSMVSYTENQIIARGLSPLVLKPVYFQKSILGHFLNFVFLFFYGTDRAGCQAALELEEP